MKKIDVACIIDDDPIYIFGVKKLIEIANFCESFLIFRNGEEAIINLNKIIQSGEKIPEVILLDLNMPIMDGWQFLDEFVKIETPKLITVYIVSSSIDPRDKDRAKQYENVSNFIVKPITIQSLKRISDEIVNK